ncbi:MAG: hypothetical protein PVF47_13480 [Anaerolineae bacterium]
MTKRRASIRGRGSEILLGESAATEAETAGETGSDEPAPLPGADETPATSPEPESPPLEDELERALFEEASGGAPPPPGETAPPATIEVEPPTTPEMEVAFIEEAFAAEIPPEPVAEEPPPTLEVTMSERELEEEMAMHEPPPPEVSDPTGGVVPPRPSFAALEMAQPPLAMDIQEPAEEVSTIELPDRDLTEEEKQAILDWLGEEWIRELNQQIDDAYNEVRRKVGENKAVATEAYNLLLKARDILARRDQEADRLAQAEYYVELVRGQIKRVEESEAAGKQYQWRILGWGFAWGAVFLVVLILMGQQWFQDLISSGGDSAALLEMDVFLPSMLWGGIGGAVAVLYSLFKHVGQRDFDSQYLVSYVGKPFLGLIIGAVVYMVFNLVIRALGIFPAGVADAGGEITPTIAPGVVYLVAWASGFKEQRILDLIDQVMKQLFPGSQEEEETQSTAQEATPS